MSGLLKRLTETAFGLREQSERKVPAYFGECAGDINTKILERMRLALCESHYYPYLMTNARARLSLCAQSR